MFIPKLARLLSALAIFVLLAASCGGETAIDTGTQPAADTEADVVENRSDQTEPTAVPATSEPEPTAVPPTTEPTETSTDPGETNDRDQDQTETSDDDDDDDDVIVLGSRDEAIEYIVDVGGFVTRDAGCIVDGAYEVFGTYDFAELEPDDEQDEQLDGIFDVCVTVVPGPAAGSPPPGTDADLDALWIACDDGSATACDDLYWQADVDSAYEAFGYSCGGRAIEICTDILGDDSGSTTGEIEGPAAGSPPPGTDAELDALWIACDDGSATACEDLFWQSPVDSDYETFGRTCGGRTSDTFCSDLLGDDSTDATSGDVEGPAAGSPPPGTDADLDALWVACDDGSATACDDLFWQSPVGSDYEAFGYSCGGRAIEVCTSLLGDDSGSTSGEIEGPAAGSPPPGTDAELDALWVACDGGSADACDDLFWQSPVDSDYETFGLTCGGRTSNSFCSDILDN